MKLNTVIFDMDGLLIDSEPLWKEAAEALFATYGKQLTIEQYLSTTGLRTKEFLAHWFRYFKLPEAEIKNVATPPLIVSSLPGKDTDLNRRDESIFPGWRDEVSIF